MEKKITIQEIETPNLLIEADGKRYELLCEYQALDKAFHKVFVEEYGKDVIIEIEKHRAIVGVFSVAEDAVRKLFDYIESSIDGKDAFVCWMAGTMEKHLAKAMAQQFQGSWKYPLIRVGMSLADKVPMFYRQKAVDAGLAKEIEDHTAEIEHAVDSLRYGDYDDWDEELPKVRQAGLLPEGWKWVDYPDLSGHLESPDGKKWFTYDMNSLSGCVEYKKDDVSLWASFPGDFGSFKENVEKTILKHVIKDVERLMGMNEMKFYVIEDKWTALGMSYFEDVSEAHERFMELCKPGKALPALGVMVGDGSVDLLHGVNGDAVLVPDYRVDGIWSEPMEAAREDIEEAARWLVMEGGGVLFEYQNDILPGWMQGDVKVLVPVTLGEKAPSSYCDDKVLKTTVANGLDAIDSLYLENHGWVAYDELLRNSKEYVGDGTIKVQFLNVNYVKEANAVGIDGAMDISPCEFKGMVEKISRPYQLTAYDGAKYTGQFRDKHEFIVGSFDTLPEAVKGWYKLQERRRVPALVQKAGSNAVLFNGFDENDKRISLAEAAEKFGFEAECLNDVLEDATSRASKNEFGGKENNMEK